MTPFEWLALGYFAALAAAIPRAARRRRGVVSLLAAIALVIVARLALPWWARAWLAHAYLMIGYWIPAALVPAEVNVPFERWLSRSWYPGWCQARAWHVPGTVVGAGLELAYLLCYPLVPAAFVTVFVLGTRGDVERFWVVVLAAGYLCYATLPWAAARPPRLAFPDDGERRGLARLNVLVLGRVSHQFVTFPSGHVAVATAAAFEVARVWPGAGVGLGVMALTIAVAAVAGRYHYLLDVVLGLLVGALVSLLTGPRLAA